jgi:hypothetical protein
MAGFAVSINGRFWVSTEGTEAMIPRQGDGRQPELRLLTVASHVDVHRLVAVETVEEKPVRARNARNLRHVAFVLGRIISGSEESAKSG